MYYICLFSRFVNRFIDWAIRGHSHVRCIVHFDLRDPVDSHLGQPQIICIYTFKLVDSWAFANTASLSIYKQFVKIPTRCSIANNEFLEIPKIVGFKQLVS